MVVAALLNVGASVMTGGGGSGVVDFFHGFQVALMMTIMFNLVQFIWWRCKAQGRNQFPTLLMLVSAIMTNVQPMAILVCGSWKLLCCPCEFIGFNATTCPWESGKSFPPFGDGNARQCHGNGNWFWTGDYKRCTGQELALFPNQWKGWTIQIVATWGGFVVMFFSVMMATQLHLKVQKRWRSVRTGRR
jgi:hypothetical protein